MSVKILLLSFALLLGCVSQPPAQPPAGATQGASGIPQNSDTYAPPSLPPPSGPAPAAPSPYAGMDFAALAALGTPVQCDINYTYQGRQYPAKVYMRGGGEIRVEVAGGSGLSQCAKTISIVQADKVYVGCQNKTVLPSCDWFSSSYNPQAPGQSSTFDFSLTPPSAFSCSDWSYDPSLFSASGRVCRLGG
jgi:hypothetical protein